MEECFVIAIDGTSASGKGTLSACLAKHYGFGYLDTGKIYRTLAYHVIAKKIYITNVDKILKLIKNVDFSDYAVLELDCEEVGAMASKLGAIPEVREKLNQAQRDFVIGKVGAVIDGRDIGTVIFPKANLKLYITAKLEVRAERRFKQLQNKGKHIIYDDVLRDLRERDERDSNREVAPLKPAPEAIIVDTSDLDQNSVLELVVALTQGAVNEKLLQVSA